MTTLDEVFNSIITPVKIWDKYVAMEYKQGIPPEAYRQLRTAFFSGMFSAMVEIHEINNDTTLNQDTGLKRIDDLIKSSVDKNGKFLDLFNDWFKQCYPEDTIEEQRKHLQNAFLQGSFESMMAVTFLVGETDEDDSIGGNRLMKFEQAIKHEIEMIIKADKEISERSEQ